jgi:hypothetical protein
MASTDTTRIHRNLGVVVDATATSIEKPCGEDARHKTL